LTDLEIISYLLSCDENTDGLISNALFALKMTQKTSADRLLTLDKLVPGANTSGLVGLKEIAEGYKAGPLPREGMSNLAWRFAYQFFKGSDYLMEAARGFDGQIVADLGAGRSLDGYILCTIAGARAYIAVEPWNMRRLYQKITDTEKLKGDDELNELMRKMHDFIGTMQYSDRDRVQRIQQRIQQHLKEGSGDLPAVLIAEDMLTFLKRIPDNTVSVLTCGLDRCMIAFDEYGIPVEEEIARVLHPEGAYLAMSSRFSPKKLKKDETTSDDRFSKFTKSA